MSAPPLLRPVEGRRVSVVRDVVSVNQVLNEDPVAACMVAARVADHGIRHIDVEFLGDWFCESGDPRRVASDQMRHELLEAAGELSARNLKCVEIGKDFMVSHGYIKNDFDVNEWARPEFLEQRVARADGFRRRYARSRSASPGPAAR